MRTRAKRIRKPMVWAMAATVALAAWLTVPARTAGQERQPEPLNLALNPVQTILRAHHAWDHVPESIRMTGTSTRGTATAPVTITATRQEQALIERGSKKTVAANTLAFSDDGEKQAFARTPPGFGQIDIAGVYLLELLTERTTQIGLPEPVTVGDARLIRLRVKGVRTEKHYFKYTVADEFDLYVDASTGLLARIERSLYPKNAPLHRTMTSTFSDYREAADGVLLPHRIETWVDNVRGEQIDVASWSAGQSVSSDLFKPRDTVSARKGGTR